MALGDRSANYNTYLGIFSGEIVQEWRKEAPSEDRIPDGKELKHRKNKNGKDVWYVGFDFVAGLIEKVELDTKGDYGSRIIITLKDVDDNYVITLPLKSSYAQNFLFKMGNLDLTKEVSFEPWSMSSEDWFKLTKKETKNGKSGLTLRQEGEKIQPVFTKDDPQGLPDLVKKKTREGVKWYDDDRTDFLLGKLDEFIAEVDKASGGDAPAKGKVTDAPDINEEDEDYDDLPF